MMAVVTQSTHRWLFNVFDGQMENFIKSNVKAALTCGDFPTTVSVMIAFFIGNLQNSLDEKTLLWIE